MSSLLVALMTAVCVAGLPVTMNARASTCPSSDRGTSTSLGRRTVEFPSGPIDGNNQAFVLSGTPTADTEITVYNNGEIVSSIASGLVGKDNTFVLKNPPPPGFVLLASYCKAADASASMNAAPMGAMTSIAREALLEAVARSSDPNEEPMLRSSPSRIQELSSTGATSPKRNDAAFTSLLLQVLQSDVKGMRRSGEAIRPAETGMEGTGDGPLSPSYSLLTRNGFAESAMRSSQPTLESGLIADPLPRSLRLFQQRFIEASDENHATTRRRKH